MCNVYVAMCCYLGIINDDIDINYCYQSENAAGTDADGIKSKLRRIVNAVNVDDMSRALAEFESSAVFTANIRLVNWFSNVWKPHLMASHTSLVVMSWKYCH